MVLPVLQGERLTVRMARGADAAAIAQYHQSNREHLEPWEPARPRPFYTKAFWKRQVSYAAQEFEEGRSARFFLFVGNDIVGSANLTNVVRGALHGCNLGYGLGCDHEGQGLMNESLRLVMDWGFTQYNLHRISAAYMPRNMRSGKLLRRLGFQIEGFARAYIRINGQWEDHVLTGLTNRDWWDPDT